MEIFFELFDGLPRQGPGSNECTKKAYTMLTNLPNQPQILDVGCGVGMQTLELARLSSGKITALDNHQPYLDELEKKAKAANVGDRIETINGSMFKMDFDDESFDVIWSEGAIYIMGLGEGLNAWKKFLKHNGYIVISDIAWLSDEPPGEIVEFWNKEYPDIRHVEKSQTIIKDAGYHEIDHFVLPEAAWWTDFYEPLEKRTQELKIKYENNFKAMEVIESTITEIAMYKKYSDCYGYVFYIMQKK